MKSVTIRVWSWEYAPDEYKALSEHGGDEDWVAVVPMCYTWQHIPWLQIGPFGSCDVSEHKMEDGSIVYIGAHA